MAPKISVIVPIYNVEKWLRRCVDSILAQTFTDFELLLIDDGSTDGSGVICDEYAGKNSRIRVFHKPNGGVSSARNIGLDNARGEWITFVDSDDWVELEYLECLLSNVGGAELSICDFVIRGSDEVWTDKIETGLISKDKLAAFYTETYPYCHLTAPWIKLYKKSIIEENNIRFKEDINTLEDTIFVLEYLRWVENITCSNRKLYNYWRGTVGLSQDDELFNRQMFQISANIYASLCRLAVVQKIDVQFLYLKILNVRFIKWVFPQKYNLNKLYQHYRQLSTLSEFQYLYKANSIMLGRKYRLILKLISNSQNAMAALGYKMLS